MSTKKNVMHDLLLIIITSLFILFVTGFSEPLDEGEQLIVIPN